MIQLYQRQLLQQLTKNYAFVNFIDQLMNNSASSVSSSNIPTKGSSKITPGVYAGYGYRFLREGQAITKDTQVLHPFGGSPWTIGHTNVGNKIREEASTAYPAGYYRVPTPAPAGFRLLQADETVKLGDHYLSETFKEADGVGSPKRIGKSAQEAVISINLGTRQGIFSEGYVTGILRKDEPMPSKAEATVGAKTKTPVDIAIDNLQAVSMTPEVLQRYDGNPQPKHVRDEMNRLVIVVEAPLREELKDARHGCKKLSEVVDRQRNKIAELEDKLKDAEGRVDNLRASYDAKSKAHDAMQKNARGNVVILRRDGFSKPMDICPTPSYSGYELPRYIRFHDMPDFAEGCRAVGAAFDKVTYRTFEARNTGRTDGFGRTIFEQV